MVPVRCSLGKCVHARARVWVCERWARLCSWCSALGGSRGAAVGAQPPGEQQAARLGVPVSCTLSLCQDSCVSASFALPTTFLSDPPSPFPLPLAQSPRLLCTPYLPLPSLPPFLLPRLSSPSITQLCIILSQRSVSLPSLPPPPERRL